MQCSSIPLFLFLRYLALCGLQHCCSIANYIRAVLALARTEPFQCAHWIIAFCSTECVPPLARPVSYPLLCSSFQTTALLMRSVAVGLLSSLRHPQNRSRLTPAYRCPCPPPAGSSRFPSARTRQAPERNMTRLQQRPSSSHSCLLPTFVFVVADLVLLCDCDLLLLWPASASPPACPPFRRPPLRVHGIYRPALRAILDPPPAREAVFMGIIFFAWRDAAADWGHAGCRASWCARSCVGLISG